MKTKILSRRNFISNAALSALAVCLLGCTKAVTRYRPDGTPYTEDVEDPLATLAAFVLLLIIIGAYAASKRNEDDSYSLNEQGDWQYSPNDKRKIRPASMVNEHNIPSSETEERISVTDSNGKLLAVANGYDNIQHKDLSALESILSSANISNLKRPIAIHLKQDKSNVYRIDSIKYLNKSSSGQFRIVERNIGGQIYKIKYFQCSENAMDIEIEPSNSGNKNVA